MPKKSSVPADRKVTATDVAERAGVSKWTVSRAFTDGASISPRALERVLGAAEALGYKPNLLARSLSKKRTNMVGLVVDEMENPNLLQVLNEVSGQLQRRGYMPMLLNITSEYSYKSALTLADQFQIDGLIFLGTVLTDELVRLAQDIRHIPLIVLYRNSDNPGIQVVSTDGYRAGHEIAMLLADQGYQRIGYMAGPVSESTQLQRVDGFEAGLRERGLVLSTVLDAGHYARENGYKSLNRYLDSVAPDTRLEALFCENDILAIGALDALRSRAEAIPLAVVGFDDIELAASPSYGLTTYHQPLQQLVDEAIRRLGAGDSAVRQLLLPGQLVLRSSHLSKS
ncbi:LacI family transcriptional regulator [Marinobacterium aestuarii]|uniref:LacI family transcriptional regulator n=1 Tax=Marinobacterium aestuarii TaxID=1821621 RepID=A0A1A9F0W2_9GAMM|nr:LacI family DNA-binding transcriptional regulator [Marinobacterium aestuarii]ANG63805.1 LacI family transcriptional regulator [Marinobacterium aestuarii]